MDKKNNHLVSVLMPAYNHARFIKPSIDSVINQTYQNIELLIVDDGSTDETFEVIKEYSLKCSERFIRFENFYQENHGTCYTLNRLLDMARGEYVLLLASDDILADNAIEEEVFVLDENADISLVVGVNKIIDSDGKVCFWDKDRNIVYEEVNARWKDFSHFISDTTGVNFYDANQFGRYDELLKCNHIANGYLIRRSIFDLIGNFTTQAPLEDYWLMLQIAKYSKMYHIPNTTFYYRWHANNTAGQMARMASLVNKTVEYEERLLINVCDSRCLGSYLSFRENYLLNAVQECRKLNSGLICANAHIDRLIASERKLQADNLCKQGHIEQLLESERQLQNEVRLLRDRLSFIKLSKWYRIGKFFNKEL